MASIEGAVVAQPEPEKVAEPKPELKAVPAPKTEDDKPKAPRERAERPASRDDNISKFARAMNSDAEKDGVAVDAPVEELRKKPGPKAGEAKAKPQQPKTDKALVIDNTERPNSDDDNAEPKSPAENDDDDDDGKPEHRTVHQLKAKARLRHGDADKAIKLAFGDLKPEEFQGAKELLAKKLGVSSKEWADFRRFEQTERAKTKQFHENATGLSQRLQAEFTPMIEAKKAYAARDYPRAFELAFGEDINDFSRKAIHQKLSTDPEKTRLQQQIDELRAKVERGPAPPEVDQAQSQRAALHREQNRTHQVLTSQTEDGEIAFLAKKAAFVQRVVEIRGENYDSLTQTTVPLSVAADMARKELRDAHDAWRYDPEASGAAALRSESPGLAGDEPVRTSRNARGLNPSLAAQAGGASRALTRDERIKLFAARMG